MKRLWNRPPARSIPCALIRTVALALLLILTCVGSVSAGEPFAPGKERDWEFLNLGKFRGTLVKMENGKAFIRMSDGVVREFWPGQGDGIAGSYFQRLMAKIPANPTKREPAPGTGPVVDISADALPAGPLLQWKNAGRLGGAFQTMNQAPKVAQVGGRKAVVFEHSPWLLPMEYQTMVSDFYMPESVIGARAFTVVAWVYNTGGVVDRETFLCWGEKDCGELDGPDFSYGCYDAMQWYDEKMSIPQPRFPKFGQWHQFVFVLTPAEKDKNRCELNLYVDGAFVVGRSVKNPPAKLLANNLAFLGCAWEAWWGHKWETRPARPFTGAMAGLKVFDRALTLAEICQLDGKAPPQVAQSPTVSGATKPLPADGSREVQATLERLAWTPNLDAISQVLHFGTDKAAVTAGTAAKVKFKPLAEEAFIAVDLPLPQLEAGRTYHWRVEQVLRDKGTVPGEVWSFKTSEFHLENDGPVSESWPKEVAQDGFYHRYMEGIGGYPILSPLGNEDVHLRSLRHGVNKLFGKRPDLLRALQSANAASQLNSAASMQKKDYWGWSPFVCSSYGTGEAILREMAIMLHETGHQVHMQGFEQLEPDFRHRLGEIFNTGRRERLWMGDYAGSNMWEYVAVNASWWVNDMSQDEGDVTLRELLRRHDPRGYHLFAEYWPGDLLIDLHAASGVEADTAGKVRAWTNRGGIEYFRPNFGWRFFERTTGRFTALNTQPSLRTFGGVSAMAFNGDSALAWDKTTWDSLDGNRAWSADAWVWRDDVTKGGETIVEWGTPEAPGAKLTWGASGQACSFPGGGGAKWTRKSEPSRWHHLAWVFTGGGFADGPGEVRLYVDGHLDSTSRMKLALPANARVTVGQGFTGGIAHLRVHNYDLHPLQLAAIWEKESPQFQSEPLATGGRLLVNLDARILASADDTETWPQYPPSMGKPWLRSWVNLGTLSGKLHNDARTPGASQPRAGVAHGARAVSFDGKSRVVSSFTATPPIEGAIELWVFPESTAGTFLQWGGVTLPAKLLRPGAWQHVALVFEKGKPVVFVNGIQTVTAPVMGGLSSERLILGGAGDGKAVANGFNGHIAQCRVHERTLSAAQVLENIRQSPLLRPSLPEPAEGAEVVVARQPTLNWQPGLGAKAARCDVYLGNDESTIAAATRTSPAYLGAKSPGELRPRLQPGSHYFWRVDLLDAKGQPQLRGPVWNFLTGQGAVIALNAAELPAGPVKSWSSKGPAPAVFTPGSERDVVKPSVTSVDGRIGVDFSGRKMLVSSMPAPATLCGSGSFTVSLRAYCTNPTGLEREQTMLSWGRRPLERAEFCWGSHVGKGAFAANEKVQFGYAGPEKENDRFRHNAPVLDGWRHIAFTFDGTAKKLRIFVDGKLNREEAVTLAVKPGELIAVGAWRAGHRPESGFAGLLAEVGIASSALPESDIARLAAGAALASVKADWLVNLNATGLAPGVLSAWPNQGSLGGEFAPDAEAAVEPRAETVLGRQAVTFDGQKSFLHSDIATPAVLTGNRPFTVEAWVLNPKLTEVETIFSLAPSVAMKSFLNDAPGTAANFNFGSGRESGRESRAAFFSSGATSRNIGWKDVPVPATEWQHIAYTFTGGYRGTFRVYLNGKLVNERGFFSLDTVGGQPMYLGAAWHTARGAMNAFSGSVAQLRVYDYARTAEEIGSAVRK